MTDSKQDFGMHDWQRLSPLSIVFFIGKFVTHLLKDALPSLAPVAIIIMNADNKAWISLLILIGIITLLLISSFLQFWYFKFKVEGQRVLVNDGVFKKNHRVIQFDRIQNINVLQPLYFKPFDLVNLQVETAGAKGNEADLAGISSSFGDYLRNHVMQQKKESASTTLESENPHQHHDEQLLANATMKDLVHYGMSSNGVFWFFVLIAPIFSFTDKLLEKWITKEDFAQLAEALGGGITGNVFLVISAVLLTITLMFSFSILGAILRYFKYQLIVVHSDSGKPLAYAKQTLKRSSGLLTSYQESLKLAKIQTVIRQSNFIGRWLGVVNMTLGQVSSGQNTPQNRASLFVIPSRTDDESHELTNRLLEACPTSIETIGINRRYVTKTIALKIFLPLLIICIPVYLSTDQSLVFAIPMIASLLLLPLVLRRWRAYRFGMKNGYAKFERGLFGFRHIIFPLFKIQKVEIKQSPIQRRRDLATIKIYLASNRVQMQYIPMQTAREWMAIISEQIEGTKKAWY